MFCGAGQVAVLTVSGELNAEILIPAWSQDDETSHWYETPYPRLFTV